MSFILFILEQARFSFLKKKSHLSYKRSNRTTRHFGNYYVILNDVTMIFYYNNIIMLSYISYNSNNNNNILLQIEFNPHGRHGKRFACYIITIQLFYYYYVSPVLNTLI